MKRAAALTLYSALLRGGELGVTKPTLRLRGGGPTEADRTWTMAHPEDEEVTRAAREERERDDHREREARRAPRAERVDQRAAAAWRQAST